MPQQPSVGPYYLYQTKNLALPIEEIACKDRREDLLSLCVHTLYFPEKRLRTEVRKERMGGVNATKLYQSHRSDFRTIPLHHEGGRLVRRGRDTEGGIREYRLQEKGIKEVHVPLRKGGHYREELLGIRGKKGGKFFLSEEFPTL
ncbi:hypothetical protein [Spirochaeta thermophila]|uniref:hypothetical protein n=1 Tax=Winmispira thermophila TaxID=154 RepID=UPI0012DFA494|nr:hypothetical protein [Spirochaeta thermophila]